MPIEPLTPERRRRQTRDALVEAAAQVFAERGFHGASLDEVAAVAGFTKGAVYSNFKSKDELFVAVLEARFERNLAALHAALDLGSHDPVGQLADFVELIRQQYNDDEDRWGALSQEFAVYAMRNPEARAKLAEMQRVDIDAITQVIANERKRHGIVVAEPPEHQARIVTALMQGLFNMHSIDPNSVDEPLLQSVMSFIGRAMLPPGGTSG